MAFKQVNKQHSLLTGHLEVRTLTITGLTIQAIRMRTSKDAAAKKEKVESPGQDQGKTETQGLQLDGQPEELGYVLLDPSFVDIQTARLNGFECDKGIGGVIGRRPRIDCDEGWLHEVGDFRDGHLSKVKGSRTTREFSRPEQSSAGINKPRELTPNAYQRASPVTLSWHLNSQDLGSVTGPQTNKPFFYSMDEDG
ncbi:hypothetical protein DL95DRAFT_407022 [Leptodontidium sp. 2 PMI_412]|nr:hypothetical protein DL95DRAFT_407022 [Leptodontidium sp. 2 PMI_412]